MSPAPLAKDLDEALRLVRVYVPDARRQTELIRAVRVGALARAIVGDDAETAARASAELGEITPDLVREIADALRTILEFEPDRTGWPDQADRAAWRRPVWRALRTSPNGERVCDAIAFRALRQDRDWAEIALAAHATLRDGERLVVFGLGANGLAAAKPLAESGRPAFACDDRPDAASPLPRIARAELRPGDTVLVTPDSAPGIIHELHKAGITRTLLPEAVWFAQHASVVAAER